MKKLSSSPTFLRLIANDRVMRLTSGVLEARQRFGQAADLAKEAWRVLLNGHELPAIDPAMRVDLEMETEPLPKRARSNGANGATESSRRSGEPTRPIDVSMDSEPPPGATRSPEERRRAAEERLARQMAQRVAITKMGGRDVFDKCYKFMAADNARKMGVYPFFRPLDLNNGPVALLEGREVIMLGSNNYLGLTTDPRVREAAEQAIEKYGTSMTGSRLVNGSMRLHNELEEKLAAYHGKEAGLVFTTGYQVNLAATSALLGNKRSVAVIDKEDHASIYDGVRLAQAAGARMVRYRHNDPESLDKCLAELDQSDGALVITDGVFSAQGEIARLDEIVKVVKKHGARIMVDDAHALGVPRFRVGRKTTPF